MKEEQIRPDKIFTEYLRLCHKDTEIYFDDCLRVEINCPACGAKGEFSFDKDGFKYELCGVCDSLYVSPRPESKTFTRYYTESPSVEYWASTFYKETAEVRRENLWKPKAKLIIDILNGQNASAFSIIDIGGGYGIFAEEIRLLGCKKVTVIEPGPTLASICRDKELTVIEKFLNSIQESTYRLPSDTDTGRFTSLTLDTVQNNIRKIIETDVEENKKEFDHKDIEDQHKDRLLAAIKAYWWVSHKNLIENMMSSIKRIISPGPENWCSILVEDDNIKDKADEDPIIKRKRGEYKKKIEDMTECLLILEN